MKSASGRPGFAGASVGSTLERPGLVSLSYAHPSMHQAKTIRVVATRNEETKQRQQLEKEAKLRHCTFLLDLVECRIELHVTPAGGSLTPTVAR